MKIKIIEDVPIDPVHGVNVGNIYELLPEEDKRRGWWIMGNIEEVKILPHEAEIVED